MSQVGDRLCARKASWYGVRDTPLKEFCILEEFEGEIPRVEYLHLAHVCREQDFNASVYISLSSSRVRNVRAPVVDLDFRSSYSGRLVAGQSSIKTRRVGR